MGPWSSSTTPPDPFVTAPKPQVTLRCLSECGVRLTEKEGWLAKFSGDDSKANSTDLIWLRKNSGPRLIPQLGVMSAGASNRREPFCCANVMLSHVPGFGLMS